MLNINTDERLYLTEEWALLFILPHLLAHMIRHFVKQILFQLFLMTLSFSISKE